MGHCAPKHQPQRAAQHTGNGTRPCFVRADRRRHFALSEQHSAIHGKAVPDKRHAKRQQHVHSAIFRIHPQQKNAAVHHGEYNAAHNGGGHIGKGHSVWLSISLDRNEKQERYQRQRLTQNADHPDGLIPVIKLPCMFIVNDPFQNNSRQNSGRIDALRHLLSCRVQQLIGGGGRNAAYHDQRGPAWTQQKRRQQQRQASNDNQPSLQH